MRFLKYFLITFIITTILFAIHFLINNRFISQVSHHLPHQTPKRARIVEFKDLPSQKPKLLSGRTLVANQFENFSFWREVDARGSLQAFKQSCQLWVRQNPNRSIGNHNIPMKVKDWLPICEQALNLPDEITDAQAKKFFSLYFRPFHWKSYHKGKFTGYYAPAVEGSKEKTREYATPVYDIPNQPAVRHLSRSQIYQGALQGKAKIVAWLKSPLDAMLLEIEGSGVIETPEGQRIYVDYAGENGRRYRSIAQLLIHDHIFRPAKASIDAIKTYFQSHPSRLKNYIYRNPSYVFFSRRSEDAFKGAQLVNLTPKYSLAVDRRYIPLGIPLLVKTKCPINQHGDTAPLQRIMIAQDTGGAIRGPIRGDIFWGIGTKAMQVANLMSHEGDYWFLLPKHFRIS
jgi:membrane-bound lytic murein transglycosylase A